MASQTSRSESDGYWRHKNKGGVPGKSGVYCVYSCVYNQSENSVSLKQLIYIGEAGNVSSRIANYEKYDDWKSHLTSEQGRWFGFGPVGAGDRERCEAAMIFKHKAPENDEYVNSFPFDQTTMKLSGKLPL